MNREWMPDRRCLVRTPLLERSPLNHYRNVEHERRERHPHAMLISEGDDGIESNFAAVFGPMPAEEFFTIAGRFFGSQSYVVVIESETATDVEAHLQAEGWAFDEEEVAMLLTPIPEPSAPPDGLRIEAVTTDQTFEDFMQIVPGNRDWVPHLDAATDPDVGLFVGYVDSESVVTSRLVRYGKIGEVTAVQTLEAHRRRGYGRAMTRAAIAEARRRGCTAVILTATEMGYPLYLGMGFEGVCAYRTYLPPRGARGRQRQ